MTTFTVWSTHVDFDPDQDRDAPRKDPYDVAEVRRSDRKVAEEDAALIRDLFKRKAWVQEST